MTEATAKPTRAWSGSVVPSESGSASSASQRRRRVSKSSRSTASGGRPASKLKSSGRADGSPSAVAEARATGTGMASDPARTSAIGTVGPTSSAAGPRRAPGESESEPRKKIGSRPPAIAKEAMARPVAVVAPGSVSKVNADAATGPSTTAGAGASVEGCGAVVADVTSPRASDAGVVVAGAEFAPIAGLLTGDADEASTGEGTAAVVDG